MFLVRCQVKDPGKISEALLTPCCESPKPRMMSIPGLPIDIAWYPHPGETRFFGGNSSNIDPDNSTYDWFTLLGLFPHHSKSRKVGVLLLTWQSVINHRAKGYDNQYRDANGQVKIASTDAL